MSKKIVIEVDQDGNVTIEGIGFVGQECKTLTKGLEAAIGVMEEAEYKPEYHQVETVTQKLVQ